MELSFDCYSHYHTIPIGSMMPPNDDEELPGFDSEHNQHAETASATSENSEDMYRTISNQDYFQDYGPVAGSIADNVASINTEEQSNVDNVDTLAVASSLQTESIEVLDALVTNVKIEPSESEVSDGPRPIGQLKTTGLDDESTEERKNSGGSSTTRIRIPAVALQSQVDQKAAMAKPPPYAEIAESNADPGVQTTVEENRKLGEPRRGCRDRHNVDRLDTSPAPPRKRIKQKEQKPRYTTHTAPVLSQTPGPVPGDNTVGPRQSTPSHLPRVPQRHPLPQDMPFFRRPGYMIVAHHYATGNAVHSICGLMVATGADGQHYHCPLPTAGFTWDVEHKLTRQARCTIAHGHGTDSYFLLYIMGRYYIQQTVQYKFCLRARFVFDHDFCKFKFSVQLFENIEGWTAQETSNRITRVLDSIPIRRSIVKRESDVPIATPTPRPRTPIHGGRVPDGFTITVKDDPRLIDRCIKLLHAFRVYDEHPNQGEMIYHLPNMYTP
jgi:hypothetical protein